MKPQTSRKVIYQDPEISQAPTNTHQTVPPKVRSRKQRRDPSKPLSGLDVHALLTSPTSPHSIRSTITAANAIPEFKQLLDTADSLTTIHSACTQLGDIIGEYIKHSVGDSSYGRAIEAMGVMREEMDGLEEPGVFNEFMRGLKKKILGGELGGERGEMWFLVRRAKLGLLSAKENTVSSVDDEEARTFLLPR